MGGKREGRSWRGEGMVMGGRKCGDWGESMLGGVGRGRKRGWRVGGREREREKEMEMGREGERGGRERGVGTKSKCAPRLFSPEHFFENHCSDHIKPRELN